jgi:Flp pilus assembly protein TadG
MFRSVSNDVSSSPCRNRRQGRRGATLVEFAVVAPLFFAMIFGIIEFGRLVMVQQIITNAAREGARRAVLEQSNASGVQAAVTQYLDRTSVPGATVTLLPDNFQTVGFGDPVEVTITVDYDRVSWLPASWFLGGTTLSASSAMCAERLE